MKSELVYPFTFKSDGHPKEKGKIASVGVLVEDKKRKRIHNFCDLVKIEYPSVLIAEAKGLLTAVGFIPYFCNEEFSQEYGNGGRFVTIETDNRELIEYMKSKNGNNGNGSEELDKIKNSILEVTEEYMVRFKKIEGGGKNLAHYLCRKAEQRLAQD